MIGMLLSMHRVSAVLSMTARPLVRTSRYERWAKRVAVGSRIGSAV